MSFLYFFILDQFLYTTFLVVFELYIKSPSSSSPPVSNIDKNSEIHKNLAMNNQRVQRMINLTMLYL
ncbi:MAG: hypothetical protein HeimC3_16010 [Candidatus Heimdallarchaeota archaeon LC_3]|nr:MAG: hypothetical protein HeimC3_16010 [Candidatus Heimdallarchaeota archaeon LC_3]